MSTQKPAESAPERILLVGGLLAVACVAAFGAAHLVNAWALDRELGALDAGTGDSALERLGTLAIGVCASAAVLLAIRRERRASLVLLSSLLAFVLVDDALGLHKHVSGWKLLYLPVFGAIAFLLWRLDARSTAASRLIRVGTLLLAFSFVAGAVGDRLISRHGWTPGDPGYELKIVFKDAAEVGGWMLIACALVAIAVLAWRR